jgi:2-polyprenyl-3-methyl-5-hydroxy-6-metoxy-1,4-benzoquinol methylase
MNKDNLKIDLIKRTMDEEIFHNNRFTKVNNEPLHYQYKPTYRIFERMKQLMDQVKRKEILELGCGTGWITYEMAALGGNVRAIDISGEAIELTRKNLVENRLDANCVVEKVSVEELKCPNESFDFVIGFAILHHLDLVSTFYKVFNLLKPGGKAIFAEPLGYNPFINIYRKLTPSYRTEYERPLRFEELMRESRRFKTIRHEEYYLSALIPLVLIYIPFVRRVYSSADKLFSKIDKRVLLKYPNLGKWAWYTIIEMQK